MTSLFLLIIVGILFMGLLFKTWFPYDPDVATINTPWYNNIWKLIGIAITGVVIMFILTI